MDSDLEPVHFGHLLEDGTIDWEDGEGPDTIFVDEVVPADKEFVYINVVLFAHYVVLSLAGIVYATCCLVFTIVFRKKK